MAFKRSHKGSATKSKAPLLEEGAYPARLVRLIDLGFQKSNIPTIADCYKMTFTFELLEEFMVDEAGVAMPDKPRWFDVDLMYNKDGYMHENSNMMKYMSVLDPKGEIDLKDLLGSAVQVMVVEYTKTGKNAGVKANKMTGIIKMKSKDLETAGPLVNPTVFFDLDEPDLAVFKALPSGNEYMPQERIKKALDFNGSKLQALLGITPTVEDAPDLPELAEEPAQEHSQEPDEVLVAPAADAEVDLFE